MNGTARKVLMLTVVVAVGMVLMTPIVDTVNNNTGQQTVTNETVNATYGERLDLQGYQINEGSETVYGYNESSDTYEVAPEDDYTMHYESGQITLNNSSTLIDEGGDRQGHVRLPGHQRADLARARVHPGHDRRAAAGRRRVTRRGGDVT